MKNIKNKKKVIIILIVSILILVIGFGGFIYLRNNANIDEVEVEQEIEKQEVIENTEYADGKYKSLYDSYKEKAYNPDDYKGVIVFDSGLIKEPIFQGETNDTYLRKDYETNEYRVDGPVFMDYVCNPNIDQNIVLYGHNMPLSMDPNQEQLFTPLHKLTDNNTLKNNNIINLVLNDRVETYEIVYIYDVKVEEVDNVQYLVEGEPDYYINNFSKDDFNKYINAVKKRNVVDTGLDIEYSDKMLTLQTCYETNVNKLIVLAKLIKSLSIK